MSNLSRFSSHMSKLFFTMIGAAGDEVTGSCTPVAIPLHDKVLYGIIDIGIVQGKNEARNFFFPLNASKLDFVIVTHAHADHFLASPLLRGFEGKIYATANALTLGKELLDDAAHNNMREAAEELGLSYEVYMKMCDELNRLSEKESAKNLKRYQDLLTETEAVKSYALYTEQDVEEIAKRFCPVYVYQNIKLADGVYARLIPTTHQDGSVHVELYVGDYGNASVNIAFSGDIGPYESFLYQKREYATNSLINYCVMEALHGVEERTQTPEEAYQQIKKIIYTNLKKGKTIIFGGFALDRCAMLVYAINRMIKEKRITAEVYLDSPLAYRELKHYQADYANKQQDHWFKDLGDNPFSTDEFIVTIKHNRHVDAVLNDSPKVVVTASAFGEGGRIVDYFDHYIQDENAVFVFTGWISPECASSVLHNAKNGEIIEIHGQHYVKHCQTIQITGFSSHGYYEEYKGFVDRYPNLKGVVLNHANLEPKNALKERFAEEYSFDIFTPEMYDSLQSSFYYATAECMREIPVLDGYEVFKDILDTNIMENVE